METKISTTPPQKFLPSSSEEAFSLLLNSSPIERFNSIRIVSRGEYVLAELKESFRQSSSN